MVQESLINYIKQLMQQGYEPNVIRNTLLNAGYSPMDVEAAMRAARAPHRVGTRTLIIIFVTLLILTGIVLITLKITKPPIVLGSSLSLFSDVVAPGQDLTANIDIRNPSGREVFVLMDYVIAGPGGLILSRTESFDVIDYVSVPIISKIPLDTLPGSYTLEVIVSYDDTALFESSSFIVREGVEIPAPVETLKREVVKEAEEAELSCPGGCDDLNFCTTDECLAGECFYTPIVPCCGNNKCESSETKASCVIDCGERTRPEDIIARAVALASQDISQSISICNSLAQSAYVDSCLGKISTASGRQEPCDVIVDDEKRDGCYIPFAYEKDFTVCDKIKNRFTRNSCLSLKESARLSGLI